MTNPVAPVEGHYARMRDGAVVGPIRNASAWYTNSTDKWGCWHTDFLWDNTGRLSGKAYDPDLDIIATISPADMQAAASGELERLRAANDKMKSALAYYADDGPPTLDSYGPWKVCSTDFGTLARCTLADVANLEAALAKMEESK